MVRHQQTEWESFTLSTSIEDAWGEIGSSHLSSPSSGGEGARSSSHHASLGFEDGGERFTLIYADLRKMMVMELGHLPLKSIALPDDLLEESLANRLNASRSDNSGNSSGHSTHSDPSDEPARLDFSHKLTDFFSSYVTAALYELQSLCRQGGYNAYIIGGQVRDMLLLRDQRFDDVDVDITVEANALEVCQFMVAHSRNFAVEECFPEFGTATLLYKGDVRFDLASTRQETYEACGALPTVLKRAVPLRFDVIRRDFTVNTLAMSIDQLGQVMDFTDGLSDMENRSLRLIHTASFFEDPSRIFRALKFLTRLNFELEPVTAYCLERFMEYAHWVYPGGGDRIRSELFEFLMLDDNAVKRHWVDVFVEKRLIRLANTALPKDLERPSDVRTVIDGFVTHQHAIHDLLNRFEGDLQVDDMRGLLYIWLVLRPMIVEHVGQVKDKAKVKPDEETAFLETAKRLELTKEQRQALVKAQRFIAKNGFETLSEQSTPVEVSGLFKHYSMPALLISALFLHADDEERLDVVFNAIHRYFKVWKYTKPILTGDDLIQMGIPQGEQLGEVLEKLRENKLMGRLYSEEDERVFVRQQFLSTHTEQKKTFATNPVPKLSGKDALTAQRKNKNQQDKKDNKDKPDDLNSDGGLS